jgi:RNA polymerase sigma factor (sigma-70 family)
MAEVDDSVLLKRFVAESSDDAIRALMDRYAPLVYGVCRRRTGQRELAEDAAQAVFLLLCRKARGLTRHPSLAGWLYTCADSVSREAVRKEARRMRYEQRIAPTGAESRETLGPDLEDAMHRLSASDREALILRFLQGHTLAEVGQALTIGEDAARMRIQRAIERLRKELTQIGFTTSAEALVGALARLQPPVPPSLIDTLQRPNFAKTTPDPIRRLTKGVPHVMTPIASIATLSAVAVFAAGGAASVRLARLTAPASMARLANTTALQSTTPTPVDSQQDITSMIQAVLGNWSMAFKGTGFGQKDVTDRSQVTVTYDSGKKLLSIHGQDTSTSTTSPNYEWPVDPVAGTVQVGTSDDALVDTSLHFVSNHLKGTTSTLLFNQTAPHLRNQLTVTYTKTGFTARLKTSVFHDGSWLKGETVWQFDRATPRP